MTGDGEKTGTVSAATAGETSALAVSADEVALIEEGAGATDLDVVENAAVVGFWDVTVDERGEGVAAGPRDTASSKRSTRSFFLPTLDRPRPRSSL